MKHELSSNEAVWMNVFALVPLVVVGIWAYMLVDWYRHARNRRLFWLMAILITNVIGYAFFVRSHDRVK